MELLKSDENAHENYRNVTILKDCPLCGSSHTKPIKSEKNMFPHDAHPEVSAFTGTWSHLLNCQDCDFSFTKEIPSSPTFFDNRYDNEWFDPEHEVMAIRKSKIVDTILNTLINYKPEKGVLLDVGSFAGKLLYFAKEKGFEPEGVEVNPKLAKYSEEKLGFKMWCMKMQNASIPSDRYDVITIIDVLEHLVDPKAVLSTLHRILKKDGVLYIKVPNAPMQIIKQNISNFLGISEVGVFGGFGHINHFSVKSLTRAVEEMGFEVCAVEMAESEYWHSDKKFYRTRNIIRTIFHKVCHYSYTLFGIPIGLNVNYILRKK